MSSPGARGVSLYSPPLLCVFGSIGEAVLCFLDPIGRWRSPERKSPDWAQQVGGRPRKLGGRPGPGPVLPPLRSRGFWSLLDGRKLRGALISLSNPDMWAFLPYFLITPYRNRQTPKLVEFCQIKP